MSLYQNYRPKQLAEVIGNEDILDSIKGLFADKAKCPHAFLLSGPTGTGKTTIARIMAEMLDSRGNDLQEVDIADYRGIDTIREIRKQCNYKPMESSARVWICDEIQKSTADAQAALLKILEDTPSHVYFILCTTDPQKLSKPLVGRCTQLQTKTLTDQQMLTLLRSIVKAENKTIQKLVYDQIIQDALGHPRNAITVLEQVLNVDEDKRLAVAVRTAEQQSQSIELCRALLRGDGWHKVASVLKGLGDQDAEGIRRHVLGYSQAVLLKEDNQRAAFVIEMFADNFFDSGWAKLVLACYSVVKGE